MLNQEEIVRLFAGRGIDPWEAFERVRAAAEELGCRARLIGSWSVGRAVRSSDVDILVVCRELPGSMVERGRIKVEILEKAGIPWFEDVHIELVEEGYEWFYMRAQGSKRF